MKDFTTTSDNKVIYTFPAGENNVKEDASITVKKDTKKIEKNSPLSSFSGGCGCIMIAFALVFLFAYQSVFNFLIQLISIIKN